MEESITPKIIIGCDPSYTHFGLSIVDRYHKTIKTYDVQTNMHTANRINNVIPFIFFINILEIIYQ